MVYVWRSEDNLECSSSGPLFSAVYARLTGPWSISGTLLSAPPMSPLRLQVHIYHHTCLQRVLGVVLQLLRVSALCASLFFAEPSPQRRNCVCVVVVVVVPVCLHTCVYIRSRCWVSSSVVLHLISLRHGLSLNQKLAILTRLVKWPASSWNFPVFLTQHSS